MKAKYTKPLLAVEMFSLAQTIARDCGTALPEDEITFSSPPKCVWDMGGGSFVFVLGTECNIDGENGNYGCYNNPSEGNYIFRS